MKASFELDIQTRVLVRDQKTDEVLLDKSNAIHTINMARAVARGLAREPNYFIYRMAFGNGGTFIDAANNIVIRPPNDGNNGDGWESRLYNETYSEVIDESNPAFLGSGSGAIPGDDPAGGGIISQEVGSKSNVIITVFLNENEPTGQLSNSSISSPTGEEREFYFDEIGLYTFGKPAQATNGVSSVNVGNKISTDELPIPPNLVLNLTATVNGVEYQSEITIPAAGTGPGGLITFGDFCEGFNGGSWITNGDALNNFVYVYITDRSGGSYPSIIGKESYGFLTFESKQLGVIDNVASSVDLECDDSSSTNFFNVLTSGICGNVNVNQVDGQNAGVANDPSDGGINERERLLTHLIFQPILKAADRAIYITYTLTISVKPSQDSAISISNISG